MYGVDGSIAGAISAIKIAHFYVRWINIGHEMGWSRVITKRRCACRVGHANARWQPDRSDDTLIRYWRQTKTKEEVIEGGGAGSAAEGPQSAGSGLLALQ